MFYSDCSLTLMKDAPLLWFSGYSIFRIHRITLIDPEKQESIDTCNKDEVRGDFLWPPHKHLTPVTVDINKFW